MNRAEQLQPTNGLCKDPALLPPGYSGENDTLFVLDKDPIDPRAEHIRWWKNAPGKVIEYPQGKAIDPKGKRLLIGDETKGEAVQVMDTCESPWANATIDRAFEELRSTGKVDVLERGFGLGITATRVIQRMATRGGTHTIIELNTANATYANRAWRTQILNGLTRMGGGLPTSKPQIDIVIIEGEAYEETKKLAEQGKQFDIIISDTFPLRENEKGMNDLLDLDILKRCLAPGGVFTFFAYFPGSTGGIMKNQRDMISQHFRDYSVTEATVNPPLEYTYLQTADGPVRNLPVVICKNPRFE